mgnify:CR=1 FL=1
MRDALLGHISRLGSSRSHSPAESAIAEATLLTGDAVAATTVQLPAATTAMEREEKEF